MKKIIFAMTLLVIAGTASAQKAKVYTAKEYMRNGDMKKAIISINEAVANEKTITDRERQCR